MRDAILKISIFTSLAIFTSHAFADHASANHVMAEHAADGFYVWADVVDVTPIVSSRYERIPVSECRIVRKKRRHARHERWDRSRERSTESALPTLFGSVLGGVIGNQFGSGNGKRAMTVIGAIAGASIANSSRNDHYDDHEDRYPVYEKDSARGQHRKVCERTYEVQEIEEIDGYEVTYRYLGREFERVTDEHPGKRLKLYVTVDPVESVVSAHPAHRNIT